MDVIDFAPLFFWVSRMWVDDGEVRNEGSSVNIVCKAQDFVVRSEARGRV